MNTAFELILVTLLASLIAKPALWAVPATARSDRARRDHGHRAR